MSYTIRPNYKVTLSFSILSNRGRYQFIGFLFLQKSASSERHLWFVLDQEAIHVFSNKGFPNGPDFRYGNFFIPRVVKNHKMSPREEKAYLPRAVVSIPETNHLFRKKIVIQFKLKIIIMNPTAK